MMLPSQVERSVGALLQDLDRLAPGVVTALYVVGSTAMGAFVPRRSDIDFVAVVAADDEASVLRALRRAQLMSGLRTARLAVAERRSPVTGCCNGVFIREHDLRLPVTQIVPLASQTAASFKIGGRGSDVSPVAWKTLSEQGIPMRGPGPSELGLDPEPARLTAWNVGNLHDYWVPWAASESPAARMRFRLRPRWCTAWGMLGPPRLHHTICTGRVVSKEAAGEYALDTFAAVHHPLILDSLAYLRSEPAPLKMGPAERRLRTRSFVREVVDAVDTHETP